MKLLVVINGGLQLWPSSMPRGGTFSPSEFDVLAFDEVVYQVWAALLQGALALALGLGLVSCCVPQELMLARVPSSHRMRAAGSLCGGLLFRGGVYGGGGGIVASLYVMLPVGEVAVVRLSAPLCLASLLPIFHLRCAACVVLCAVLCVLFSSPCVARAM